MARSSRYDDEFKNMIVNLYRSGKSVTELISEYGISRAIVYRWVNLYSPIETSNGELTNNDEIRKLKKQLTEAMEENEILKKAVAIFREK